MSVERRLHHFPLDPASRQVRLVLGEKRLRFTEVIERYWEMPESLSALNPSGLPPVLVEERTGEKLVVCETRAILEYLEERYSDPPLLNNQEVAPRVEARRLVQWFDRKFDLEVNSLLMEGLLKERDWLADNRISLADMAAGAAISVLDYFGEIPWDEFASVRLWYAKLKSRPAFRPLLADRYPGLAPASHYDDLDF